MPVASSPSTSRRLLALLSLLQSRRDWPAPVLAARLEVSERTVRRDVDRLRELDYTVEATRGPDGGYRLGSGSRLPPLLFDDEQVVALTLALRTAGALGAGLEEAAERALGTVSRLMPERLSARVAGLVEAVTAAETVRANRASGDGRTASSGRAAEADPAVLLRIGQAIRSQHELRFDYASPASGAGRDPGTPPPVRTVEPHHLILHRGRWYLLGYSPERADWRTYRVDRLAPRTHDGRRFERRAVPGGDPVRYLAARFKGSGASGADVWPCEGEAVVHAPLAEIAPYLGDGSVEALDADRCRVRLGAWSWDGLAAGFCRFPAEIVQARPAELRAAFASLAARSARAADEAVNAGIL